MVIMGVIWTVRIGESVGRMIIRAVILKLTSLDSARSLVTLTGNEEPHFPFQQP